jgi:hypothetical protein
LIIIAEVKVWDYDWMEIVNDENFQVDLDKDSPSITV